MFRSGELNFIPDKIKEMFFEHQKMEWQKVVETSEGGLKDESRLEYISHWQEINVDAKRRIKEIDEKLRILRLNGANTALNQTP